MTTSMDAAPVQLKLDPWASDVDGALAIAAADNGDGAPTVPVDTTAETPRWEAIDPPPAGGSDPAAGPLLFIDGVRRVDARLLATLPDGARAFGLLGSFAVGALSAGPGNGPPAIVALEVERRLVLGRGTEHRGVVVEVPGNAEPLRYEPLAVPGVEPEAPLQGLQTAMRRAEADLARELAESEFHDGGGEESGRASGLGGCPPSSGSPAGGVRSRAPSWVPASDSRPSDSPGSPGRAWVPSRPSQRTGSPGRAAALVIADGPLAYLERTRVPLLGFVKSLHRAYLGPAELELLARLRPGQRTPLFAILDGNQRYSWYLRLGTGGAAEHDLAGIARLECASHAGLEAVRAAADRSAALLLASASTRQRDPRSPQNLIPLGGLEAALRHRLGDRGLIRRAITAYLAEGDSR